MSYNLACKFNNRKETENVNIKEIWQKMNKPLPPNVALDDQDQQILSWIYPWSLFIELAFFIACIIGVLFDFLVGTMDSSPIICLVLYLACNVINHHTLRYFEYHVDFGESLNWLRRYYRLDNKEN